MGVNMPVWLDGTVMGVMFLIVVVPFVRAAVANYKRKAADEATLAAETLRQLRERNQALADERTANASEVREMRKTHAGEMRSERENSVRLQERVMDLSSQMVAQAQAHADHVMRAVEAVRKDSSEGIARLERKLELSESLTQECERRHILRDQEEARRRELEDSRNRERDAKIASLIELVQQFARDPE